MQTLLHCILDVTLCWLYWLTLWNWPWVLGRKLTINIVNKYIWIFASSIWLWKLWFTKAYADVSQINVHGRPVNHCKIIPHTMTSYCYEILECRIQWSWGEEYISHAILEYILLFCKISWKSCFIMLQQQCLKGFKASKEEGRGFFYKNRLMIMFFSFLKNNILSTYLVNALINCLQW